MIATRRSKRIRTSIRRSGQREDDCNKDRQSDINKEMRRVEEDHEGVNIKGDDFFEKEKEKKITKRRSAVMLKR